MHHLLFPVEVESLGEQVEDVLVVELEEGDLDLEAVVVEPALLLSLEDLHQRPKLKKTHETKKCLAVVTSFRKLSKCKNAKSVALSDSDGKNSKFHDQNVKPVAIHFSDFEKSLCATYLGMIPASGSFSHEPS